jgi:hypothetical protein
MTAIKSIVFSCYARFKEGSNVLWQELPRDRVSPLDFAGSLGKADALEHGRVQ